MHDVVKGGVKVTKSIGLVMEISEIYVENYQKMLSDENYTPDELAAISSGYAMLIDESSDVLQGKTISVSYLRARKKNDMDRVMSLYGTANERYW